MSNKTSNPILDPIVQKFVDQLAKQGGKPLYELSISDARNVFDAVQETPILVEPVDSEDRSISIKDNKVNIQIIRPKNNTNILPVIIYMHGGGWVFGGIKSFERLIHEIANGTQAAVVFVEYTRAPEGKYPLAHEQGYTAAQWVAEHAQELKLDSSRMVIAGDSVGGLMATAIAMMAQERGGPKFIFQLLFYPVTNDNFTTPSYDQFAQGPWLTKLAMEWFWDNYVPHTADRAHPFAAPLKASLEQLKQLPPALIFTNESDVLRDEGEAYAHKLMQAGVPVVAFRAIGMIHDCVLLNAITNTPGVRAIINHANKALVEIFAKKQK